MSQQDNYGWDVDPTFGIDSQTPKEVVMSDILKPKQGAAILLRYGHDLFLLLRDDKPNIGSPLQWAVLAGAIEDGETADQAVHREILEEVGTAVSDLETIGASSTNTWYMGSLSGQQATNLKRGEGCGHGFFSFDALRGLVQIEGKGSLGGAIRRFMQNAPEEIEAFLSTGKKPSLELMSTMRTSSPPVAA